MKINETKKIFNYTVPNKLIFDNTIHSDKLSRDLSREFQFTDVRKVDSCCAKKRNAEGRMAKCTQ